VAQVSRRGVEGYRYSAGSRLATVTSSHGIDLYGFDADGRLESIERDGRRLELAYRGDDSLTEVRDPGTGWSAVYTIDGLGRRVAAQDPAGTRRYLRARAQDENLEVPHAVTDGSGALLSTYVYAGSEPLMRISPSGEAVYYLADAMGSVLALADDAEAQLARFDYDGFGAPRAATGTATTAPAGVGGDFRFHGSWLEEGTGLYHLRARDYDPRTGRFVSRDPVEPNLHLPESIHPYAFANSNPFVYVDPTGMFSLVGLNMSLSMQDILRSVQSATMNAVREKAKDEVAGIVSELVLRTVDQILPNVAGLDSVVGFFTDPSDDGAAGRKLDELMADAICGFVKSSVYSRYTWLQVPMDPDGEPTANGFHCGGRRRPNESYRAWRRRLPTNSLGGGHRPDFLTSKAEPLAVADRRAKSYLVGEVKLNVRNFIGNPRQLDAITNHASDYQYVPAVFLIAWRAGSRSELRQLRNHLVARGTFGVLVTFVGGGGGGSQHVGK
jgi:RHS repeat-associated protein